MNERDILNLIERDEWMMEILKTVRSLKLPDSWVGGGFIRSKVWDHLHGYKNPTSLPDVDVIYFDPDDFSKDEMNISSTKMEKGHEESLMAIVPTVSWEVVNQARMHLFHNCPAYKNSSDALKDWVETATCIAIKVNNDNSLSLSAPWGIGDLTNLILRPANKNKERVKEFHRRIEAKGWLKKWPKLKVIDD